jgi:hypothetical protein
MSDEDGDDLSRRLHWDAGDRPPRGAEEVAHNVGAPEPFDDGAHWDDEVGWSNDSSETGKVALGASAVVPSFERRDLARMDLAALDRRRQLWRDTALLLSGLVAALLVANLVLPEIAGLAAASPTPFGAGPTVGPSPSPQEAAGPTQAPSPGPSLGIDVTPTRGPAITLPPTGTSAPSTPRPIVTPKPTRRPTPPPTRAPTPAPTPEPTPEITPTPAPTVHVSCSALPALTVSCSGTMTHEAPGSEVWDMGGSGTLVTGGNGSDSITFIYDAEGTYHVVLSITGLDGSSKSDGTDVTVSAL